MTKAIGIPQEYLTPNARRPVVGGEGPKKVAHTIAYDGRVMDDTMSGKPLSAKRTAQWVHATMLTLVLTGGAQRGVLSRRRASPGERPAQRRIAARW